MFVLFCERGLEWNGEETDLHPQKWQTRNSVILRAESTHSRTGRVHKESQSGSYKKGKQREEQAKKTRKIDVWIL